MKCKTISFVKCTFVLTMVQGFPVSELDSKYCVRYHFTVSPVVNLLKTTSTANPASLRKKKKLRFKFSNFFVCVANTKQCA